MKHIQELQAAFDQDTPTDFRVYYFNKKRATESGADLRAQFSDTFPTGLNHKITDPGIICQDGNPKPKCPGSRFRRGKQLPERPYRNNYETQERRAVIWLMYLFPRT